MSTATNPLWDQAVPETSEQTHPLWDQATPESKDVMITSDPKSGFVSGFKDQFSPAIVGGVAGASLAPIPATAIGFGVADRNSFQTPERLARIKADFSAAHDKATAASKNGDYLGAAKAVQDLFLGEGVKEPVDAIEDKIGKKDYSGAAGTALGVLAQFALGHGLGKLGSMGGELLGRMRTPDPDLSLLHATNPHSADTDFMQTIPDVRASVKRGEALSGTPITDVPSAIKATQAAMDEKMQALESHKEWTRLRGDTLPITNIKTRAIAALPSGLDRSDPEAYKSAVDEINRMFSGSDHLDVDQVFDQARLNNGVLSRFHASPESNQNNKLITNGGDTGVLKAIGDTNRQWINEHVGPMASDINSSWGELNQFKHYLQDKINASAKESPLTDLGKLGETLGINPTKIGGFKDLVGGLVKKATGQPDTIDGLIKAAMDQTEAAKSPWEPNRYQYNNPGDTTKQLGPASVITETPEQYANRTDTPPTLYSDPQGNRYVDQRSLPAATSRIGVSGVTVPDIMGGDVELGADGRLHRVAPRNLIESNPGAGNTTITRGTSEFQVPPKKFQNLRNQGTREVQAKTGIPSGTQGLQRSSDLSEAQVDAIRSAVKDHGTLTKADLAKIAGMDK